MESPQDALRGCAEIARALALQAASGSVSPEALDLLADKVEEAARLLDGERIERWIEVIRDADGTEREVHEDRAQEPRLAGGGGATSRSQRRTRHAP